MKAFGRIKLPRILTQALDAIAIDDLLKTEGPYENLLLAIGYPRRTPTSKLVQQYFTSFVREPPQNVTVTGLVDYLRKGIISDLREQLKVPIHVDENSLEAALENLTAREKDIIRRRFFKGETLETIGEDYHRSSERIRTIEGKALRRLRNPAIFSGVRYAIPEKLLEYTRGLEERVAKQDLQIAQRDLIIGEYESRFGPLQIDAQQIISREELDLRRKLDCAIEEIEMDVRSYNCLKNANIKTIRTLVQKTEEELLRTKNFGRKSLNEIKGILAEMGLHLGMELPEHFLKEN